MANFPGFSYGHLARSSIRSSSTAPQEQINAPTRGLNETESKVVQVVAERFEFKWLAEGKEKVVYVKVLLKGEYPHTREEQMDKVYYVPVQTLFGSRESDLRREFEIMNAIKEKLGNDAENYSNLALEAVELKRSERIDGQYTLEVDRAGKNFEEIIKSAQTDFQDRVGYGRCCVQGLAQLHSAGYAYGDSKPENCLVFGKTLKLSDFGKTTEVGDGVAEYTGNTRFAPPEGSLSKRGDVYGAALILIRNFEEEYLTEDNRCLQSVEEGSADFDERASDDLGGR